MDQIALYKGFQIRAYKEWSGQWLAEARKPGITAAMLTILPRSPINPTPEAAIDFIKHMIDSPSTRLPPTAGSKSIN
jgi:hypothetical protein